jgi:hypothetical protein
MAVSATLTADLVVNLISVRGVVTVALESCGFRQVYPTSNRVGS